MKKLILSLFVAIGVIGNASAATISIGTQYSNPSGSQAPGQEYALYNGTSLTSNLQNFSVSFGLPTASDSGFASLVLPGATNIIQSGLTYAYNPGFEYRGHRVIYTNEIFSFSITGTQPSSFKIWVLDGNSSGGLQDNSFILSDSQGDSVTQTTPGGSGLLEWTGFYITNAVASDVFTLKSTSYNINYTGGVTFSVVPEPSTYALFGLGVFGLLMVLQRKKTA